MPPCLFASDLHGRPRRYERLWAALIRERPAAVLLGGDLLPGLKVAMHAGEGDFVSDFLFTGFGRVRAALGADYPAVFLIPGNDDPRTAEPGFVAGEQAGLWTWLVERWAPLGNFEVCGYPWVPPTPFLLKDWERYDVSRYVDPGCVAPEEGRHTVALPEHAVRYATIADDLARLMHGHQPERAIMLCHAPPYRTKLDRAALDGRRIDGVELDVHVGSVALRRFIEAHEPRLTLHGHIHEAARLTSAWREQLGRTWCLSAAHDGPELALVRCDPAAPEQATRELL